MICMEQSSQVWAPQAKFQIRHSKAPSGSTQHKDERQLDSTCEVENIVRIIFTASQAESEKYYLWTLLLHITRATSCERSTRTCIPPTMKHV